MLLVPGVFKKDFCCKNMKINFKEDLHKNVFCRKYQTLQNFSKHPSQTEILGVHLYILHISTFKILHTGDTIPQNSVIVLNWREIDIYY